jgi:mono/diheme cytochrome c family protein
VRLFCAAAALTALAACDVDDWKPDVLREGKSSKTAATLKRGREQYSMYCAGCHGENGDGEGPAARFMSPKPRDFRKGRVKFAATPANTLPRDEDLLNTINHGLHGTSMPAWNLIAHEDKLAIVAYLKTFSEVWQKETPGAPVPLKPDPWRKKDPAKAIAEGERVYHGIAACSSCHPAYATKPNVVEHMKAFELSPGFRDAMYESVEKESDWGAPIKPPDFLVDRTKIASTKEELVRVIAAGVGGTAMPSWGDTLTDKQLWGLAYYVESLVQMRDTPEAKALKKSLLEQPPYTLPKPEPPKEEPKPAADALDGGAGDGGNTSVEPDGGKADGGKK